MSTSSSRRTLSLGEEQLAKLTNDSLEIRMRALEQVETRFIRCLQHGESIKFKPVLLLKQLIRWFGHTPPTAADRVVAMMLELMRSHYGKAVVRKIPSQRMQAEIEKIRKILCNVQTKRAIELLDDLQRLTAGMYIEANPSVSNSSESQCSTSEETWTFSIDSLNLEPDDYEVQWQRPSVDDMATMTTIVDSLTIEDEQQLQENLINIQIKLSDYPVSYLLQKPHIFLQLLHLQPSLTGETLLLANRTLQTAVYLIQRTLSISSRTVNNAKRLGICGKEESLPQQLRISSALTLLLSGCLELIAPPVMEQCHHNWHVINLIVEVFKALKQLKAPIPDRIVQRLNLIVPKVIRYCNHYDVDNPNELDSVVQKMKIPRLHSSIFNGLMQDAILLNISTMNPATARLYIHPMLLDSCYLSSNSTRTDQLYKLRSMITKEPPIEDEQMQRIKAAYNLALTQLVATKGLPPMELVLRQSMICQVLVQLGSESLVEQLCKAIYACISFYPTKPIERVEAESLIHTLFGLPDPRMRSLALRQLMKPVVEHFYALMNKTAFVAGQSSLELIRHNIFGLPMSTLLIRQLLILGWRPQHQGSQDLKQFCIDYLTLLLRLSKIIATNDFCKIFEMLLPVLPLIVCRAIEQPHMEDLLWQLLKPDGGYLDPMQTLRGNMCYMFHSDAQMRQEAIARIAYLLGCMDNQNRYRPVMNELCLSLIRDDVCITNPPIDYCSLFNESENRPFTNNLQALICMLETIDLKPDIRKSTLRQLNVQLHNWNAAEAFVKYNSSIVICLKELHGPLIRERPKGKDYAADLLLPAVSILLRMLCRCKFFRSQLADNTAMLACLMRSIFLLPHEKRLCAEACMCLFLAFFPEHITCTADSLKIDVDVSAMSVPFTYELDNRVSPNAATEGLACQENLLAKYFEGDEAIEAQYWRFFVAQCICGPPASMNLSVLMGLDIRESLKVRLADLALSKASNVQLQMENQLLEAKNCTTHEALHQVVASFQLFVLRLRDDMALPHATSLWLIINEYLRVTPGNESDRQLYIALLELCLSCLRQKLYTMHTNLSHAIETDPHHSFILLILDLNVPLKLLRLVTECLVQLLCWRRDDINVTWHGKFFMELSTVARDHFELRNLQHVRCTLSVLRLLSERPLHLDDYSLFIYYQHFVHLSCNLRSTTQTGAQWQRDCLLIICQLQARAQWQLGKDNNGTKVLRYLVAMCGHSDDEVRSLAWVGMANCIKSSGKNMVGIMDELKDFLPGGLGACCLSTMLDDGEQMLVRELSGRVFVMLMNHIGAAACIELLMLHSFLKHAYDALDSLQLVPNNEGKDAKVSCELISSFVSICTHLIVLQPSWCATLCDHAFINALSDVVKLPTPEKAMKSAYVELCAGQICKLYALCYLHNFAFLQRSICRDSMLLSSYFFLIGDVLDQEEVPQTQLIQMLKLLVVFCKDKNAYDFLFEMFCEKPVPIVKLITRGLNQVYIYRPVQKYTLDALSVLLRKALESKRDVNVMTMFDVYVEKPQPTQDSDEELDNDNKENNINAINKQIKISSLKPLKKRSPTANTAKKLPPTDVIDVVSTDVVVFLHFNQLFEMLYPAETYSFLKPPTKSHVQICEGLGYLLRLSPLAGDLAIALQLMNRVILLLNVFLEDPTVGNATVFVRRVGAHKSRDIINNLLLLLNMVMQWHNAPHAVITDPVVGSKIVVVLLRMWPWLSHSALLKQLTVRLMTVLTEHSFEMCKQTSQVLYSQSHSLLHLMVRVADHETTKKEAPSVNSTDSIIKAALRVMINCCSCAEGRTGLSKMRVLDMFDTILPASRTGSKVKPDVLLGWLAFWEVFSRYELGSKICHFQSLLLAVRRSPPLSQVRLSCLRILRNMCFGNGNRITLVNSTEFVDLLRDVVSRQVHVGEGEGEGDTIIDSYSEHHLVVLCLWKLFGFSAKLKAMLRGTKLYKQLTILSDHLKDIETNRLEKFQTLPFAAQLKDLLGKLFESVKA